MKLNKYIRCAAIMLALMITAVTAVGCGSIDNPADAAAALLGRGIKAEPAADNAANAPQGVSHTHNYDVTVVAPTCTERGSTTYTCSVCGDTYTEYTSAVGHTLEPGWSFGYDDGYHCTECGFELYPDTSTGAFTGDMTCAACGKKVDYTIDSPTCIAAGALFYTCKSCGQEYSASIPKKLHYCTSWTTRMSDCEGVTTYTCLHCGQVIDEEKVELVPDDFDKDYWTRFAAEYAESLGLTVSYGIAPEAGVPIHANAEHAYKGSLEKDIKERIDLYANDYEVFGINIWWEEHDACYYGDAYTEYCLYIGY